jgi:hypothetical protein
MKNSNFLQSFYRVLVLAPQGTLNKTTPMSTLDENLEPIAKLPIFYAKETWTNHIYEH